MTDFFSSWNRKDDAHMKHVRQRGIEDTKKKKEKQRAPDCRTSAAGDERVLLQIKFFVLPRRLFCSPSCCLLAFRLLRFVCACITIGRTKRDAK